MICLAISRLFRCINISSSTTTFSFHSVQWKWSKNHSIEDFQNVKTFIILEGERVRSQINQDGSNLIPVCQLSQQKVFIFMLKGSSTAICVSEETNLNTFAIVAESIAELINKSTVEDVKVVTVNVLPVSSYKIAVDERLDGDVIIRGLNPDAQTRVSALMEPNILTGISAAGTGSSGFVRQL